MVVVSAWAAGLKPDCSVRVKLSAAIIRHRPEQPVAMDGHGEAVDN
jgi:hypothetical protein